MTVLVFGRGGQLGSELARYPHVKCLNRSKADLSQPGVCASVIRSVCPRSVINAAAYTAVDQAEKDEALAMAINGAAPGEMARECAALGIPFVSISTDYVFPGEGEQPWRPEVAPAPLGAYGRTKLAGEQAIAAAGGVSAVLRTSWVVSAHGANFVSTMLRLGQERDRLSVVADQIGGPTPARDIAAACLAVAEQLGTDPAKAGTYHFAGTPDISWAGFAREIFAQAGIACEVEDISSCDYPTTAQRPHNSRLDCTSLTVTFGIRRPDWKKGLSEILNEMGEIG